MLRAKGKSKYRRAEGPRACQQRTKAALENWGIGVSEGKITKITKKGTGNSRIIKVVPSGMNCRDKEFIKK